MLGVITSSSPVLWYLVRASGLVDLVLLSAVMVLGITEIVRWTRPGWPRFVLAALHRNLSLLALVILALHLAITVVDSFVRVNVVDLFVPFVGSYHGFWLGLGALAVDLMVAVMITSLFRRWIGYRMWRVVHWTAYACWPVAVAHGLGMGTDRRLSWVLGLNALCVIAVAGATIWRLRVTRRGLSRPGRPHVVKIDS